MASFRINEGSGWKALPQWVPAEGQKTPKDILDLLRDPSVIKTGWNFGGFEYYIYKQCLGIDIPPEEIRDTMVMAMQLSLPGALADCGEVLRLDQDKKKDARGKRLIGMFCEPHLPTKKIAATRYDWRTHPQEWEEFKGYNDQDTLSETTIFDKIVKWDMPPEEWETWAVDQHINRAGAPVNAAMIDSAIRLAREVAKRGIEELRDITGLANPNSGKQLLGWLQQNGYKYEDLKKGHVSRAVEQAERGSALRRVLQIRQEVSKSSVKKYIALKNGLDDDGMVRGMFQFAGAGRTWRWAGRRAQLQNLAKAPGYLEKIQIEAAEHVETLDYSEIRLLYAKPMELLSATIRPSFKAPEGYTFVDADLNAIENRVLGWVAGEKKILKVFEEGRCPYVDFGTLMYSQSYAELWAEYQAGNKKKRNGAKPAVLGCGFRLSAGEIRENRKTGEQEATGLLGYAWNMGVRLTKEEAEMAVRIFRENFKKVVSFWYDIEDAAKDCIATGRPQKCRVVEFERDGPLLRMWLPSGHALTYVRPRIEEKRTPWGAIRPTITYEGQNDKNQWDRIQTHGGKLTENCVQGIARDLLADALKLSWRRGLQIRMHVHDQIVALAKQEEAKDALELLMECMSTQPKWAKASAAWPIDLPLASAGIITPNFIKD